MGCIITIDANNKDRNNREVKKTLNTLYIQSLHSILNFMWDHVARLNYQMFKNIKQRFANYAYNNIFI